MSSYRWEFLSQGFLGYWGDYEVLIPVFPGIVLDYSGEDGNEGMGDVGEDRVMYDRTF